MGRSIGSASRHEKYSQRDWQAWEKIQEQALRRWKSDKKRGFGVNVVNAEMGERIDRSHRGLVDFSYISACIPTHLFGPVVVTSWPTLGSTLVLIRFVRIGTPITLTFIVTSLQHCDLGECVVTLS